ncbi:hypothetical protein C8Q75DRAFT_811462 [Abortiporus biennis]|nr:hypothetical protein C8Q75DRAFT_811462 [Abortiporus biennis]
MLTRFVPIELAEIILHYAEYYLIISAEQDSENAPHGIEIHDGDCSCAATGNLTEDEVHSIVKLSVVVEGHDQGWSSYPQDKGTTRNSWTWYSLRLYDSQTGTVTILHDPLATNLHAVSETQKHEFTWFRGDDTVSRIHTGQSIAIWAHARYPGWRNHIVSSHVEVSCYPEL